MQLWELFIILKQPVNISVTVSFNLTKLTNHPFYLYYQNINRSLAKQDDAIIMEISVLTSSTSVLSFNNGGIISEQKRLTSLIP